MVVSGRILAKGPIEALDPIIEFSIMEFGKIDVLSPIFESFIMQLGEIITFFPKTLSPSKTTLTSIVQSSPKFKSPRQSKRLGSIIVRPEDIKSSACLT